MYGPGRFGSHLTFLVSSQKDFLEMALNLVAAWKETARELTICTLRQKMGVDEKISCNSSNSLNHGFLIVCGYLRL